MAASGPPGAWQRTVGLSTGGRRRRHEAWTAPDGRSFPMDVRLGKDLDVRGLKDSDLGEVRDYEAFLRETARRIYTGDAAPLAACPCCGAAAAEAPEALRVFEIAYVRCPGCGHGYVRDQPANVELDELFETSEAHSSTYTDPATLEIRMQQVVRPKVRWVREIWEAVHGGVPATALDVGAGGGHMVAGFREEGISASGFELSASSRRFAAETFDLVLRDDDFLAPSAEPAVDLITFWGLLEYTPDPAAFVAAARRRAADRGLLVVEVPRFECVGTAVQALPGAVVSRHLDPTSHVNCFTDSSLATILLRGGFAPVGAWYFGMDSYELLVQLALLAGDEAFDQLAEAVLALQPALDEAITCDDIVVAAVPI